MEEKFDPYHQWLGIPADEQPPDHYRLLGIPLLETSAAVIENAANQRMGHLRTFQTGKHSVDSQRLLNEVAAARVCLLRPEKKAAYDIELRNKLAPKATPVVAEAEPEAIDPELAAIFRTPPASGAAAISKRSNKKPPSLSPPSIAAIVAAASGMVLLGLWIAFSQSDKPDRNQTPAGVASSATGSSAGPRTPAGSESPPSNPRPSTSTASTAALVAANPKKESAGAGSRTSGTQPSHTNTENAAAVPAANSDAPPRGTAAPAAPEVVPNTERPIVAEPASGSSPDGHAPPGKEKTAAKRAPPSAEQQKKLIAEFDDIYKLKEAKDSAARVALARRLFDDGKKQRGNANEQFVLLRRASELAGDAGDTDLVLEVVDATAAAGFDIQPLRVKTLLLKRVLEQTSRDGENISATCEDCRSFAEDAASQGAVDEALDVLDAARKAFAESVRRAQATYITARTAAARTRDATEKAARAKTAAQAQSDLDAAKAAQSAVAECVKSIQQTVRQRQAVQAAEEKLKTAPDDPAACLTIGRWQCFHEGDWDGGLNLLAKGSDQTLKLLAVNELASKPSTADQRVGRGDAWWYAAEKSMGDDKLGMRRRAEYWYSQALPDLTGLDKAKTEKRLELLASDTSRQMVLAKTKICGAEGGEAFEDENAGALMIGLCASRARTVIASLEAIYQIGPNQVKGPLHGTRGRKPVTVIARPGYAIAGIKTADVQHVFGFRIVFMRVKDKKLDPADSYESDWVGFGPDSGEMTRLGCNGNSVVGFFGRTSRVINAFGLIQLVPDQQRTSHASPPAAKVAPAAPSTALVKTKIIGGKVGQDFEESKAETMLIGLTVTTGDFSGHKVISSIQATYQSGRSQVSGNIYGKRKGEPVTLLAKPGYAVAGIKAYAGIRFDGFRIVFMRIKGHQLDPADTYESDWVGGKKSDDRPSFGCDGNPVVGIFGKQGGNIVAIGLIQLAPGKGTDSPAAAQ